jgi:hypothetical protein
MTQITREEIEQATDAVKTREIYDLTSATKGTRLLSTIFAAARTVTLRQLIFAAYHHGIRIGMEIEARRALVSKERQASGPDNL